MKINYDFVHGPFDGQGKVLDESGMPLVVSGGTYRPTGNDRSTQGGPTSYTTTWTEGDAPGAPSPITVGEPFSLDEQNVGDCSARKVDGSGIFIAGCFLNESHLGQHVASNGETVVEVWY